MKGYKCVHLSHFITKNRMSYISLCLSLDVCDPTLLAKPCLHDGYQDPKNCSRCRCADGLGGDYCEEVQLHPHSAGNVIQSGLYQLFKKNPLPFYVMPILKS